jgi:hypothetical protein
MDVEVPPVGVQVPRTSVIAPTSSAVTVTQGGGGGGGGGAGPLVQVIMTHCLHVPSSSSTQTHSSTASINFISAQAIVIIARHATDHGAHHSGMSTASILWST